MRACTLVTVICLPTILGGRGGGGRGGVGEQSFMAATFVHVYSHILRFRHVFSFGAGWICGRLCLLRVAVREEDGQGRCTEMQFPDVEVFFCGGVCAEILLFLLNVQANISFSLYWDLVDTLRVVRSRVFKTGMYAFAVEMSIKEFR